MSEDHQTRTVSGAAAWQRARAWEIAQEVMGERIDLEMSQIPRLSRGELHPNDPNHVDEPGAMMNEL